MITMEEQNDWYNKYRGLVWSVIERLGVPPQDAEDVSQECWLAICANRGKKEESGERSTTAWICTIARRTAFDYYRDKKRRRELQGQEGLIESIPWPADEEPTVAEAIRDETKRAIEGGMETLDPTIRKIAVMRFREERRIKEIANELGLSPSAVKKRLVRLSGTLRELLGQAGEDLAA